MARRHSRPIPASTPAPIVWTTARQEPFYSKHFGSGYLVGSGSKLQINLGSCADLVWSEISLKSVRYQVKISKISWILRNKLCHFISRTRKYLRIVALFWIAKFFTDSRIAKFPWSFSYSKQICVNNTREVVMDMMRVKAACNMAPIRLPVAP